MLFAIYCVDKPGSAPLRAEALEKHRAYLSDQSDKIVIAGATLSDDGETATGSLFIVNVPDRAAAETFSNGDPFTRAGVFESVTITRMRKGFWFPENAEGA